MTAPIDGHSLGLLLFECALSCVSHPPLVWFELLLLVGRQSAAPVSLSPKAERERKKEKEKGSKKRKRTKKET